MDTTHSRWALVRLALPSQRICSLRNNRFVDPNKNLTPITAEFGITPITAEPYFSLWSVIGFSNCTSSCVKNNTCNTLLVSTIDKAK
jgi:hypothetical protein